MAGSAQSLRPTAGYYHRRLGNLTVTALYDGHVDTPIEDLAGIDTVAAAGLQDAYFRPKPQRLPMTVFALTDAEGTIMIDFGGRPALDPDLGLRADNMRAAGIDPDKVHTILLTHLHTDHYGGLINTNGKPVLPKAELVLHADDVPFRLSPPANQNITRQ